MSSGRSLILGLLVNPEEEVRKFCVYLCQVGVFSWCQPEMLQCVCLKYKMKCAQPLWYFGISVNSHTVLAQADGLSWNYLLKELD